MPPKRPRSNISRFQRSYDENAGFATFDTPSEGDWEEVQILGSQEEQEQDIVPPNIVIPQDISSEEEPSPKRQKIDGGFELEHSSDFEEEQVDLEQEEQQHEQEECCQDQINYLKDLISGQNQKNLKRYLILAFCYAIEFNPIGELEKDGHTLGNPYLQEKFEDLLKLKEGEEITIIHPTTKWETTIKFEWLQEIEKKWLDAQEWRKANYLTCPNVENPLIVDFKVIKDDSWMEDPILWGEIVIYFCGAHDFIQKDAIMKELSVNNITTWKILMTFYNDHSQQDMQDNFPHILSLALWLHRENGGGLSDFIAEFIDEFIKNNDCIPQIQKYVEKTRSKEVPQDFIDFIKRGNFFLFLFLIFFFVDSTRIRTVTPMFPVLPRGGTRTEEVLVWKNVVFTPSETVFNRAELLSLSLCNFTKLIKPS